MAKNTVEDINPFLKSLEIREKLQTKMNTFADKLEKVIRTPKLSKEEIQRLMEEDELFPRTMVAENSPKNFEKQPRPRPLVEHLSGKAPGARSKNQRSLISKPSPITKTGAVTTQKKFLAKKTDNSAKNSIFPKFKKELIAKPRTTRKPRKPQFALENISSEESEEFILSSINYHTSKLSIDEETIRTPDWKKNFTVSTEKTSEMSETAVDKSDNTAGATPEKRLRKPRCEPYTRCFKGTKKYVYGPPKGAIDCNDEESEMSHTATAAEKAIFTTDNNIFRRLSRVERENLMDQSAVISEKPFIDEIYDDVVNNDYDDIELEQIHPPIDSDITAKLSTGKKSHLSTKKEFFSRLSTAEKTSVVTGWDLSERPSYDSGEETSAAKAAPVLKPPIPTEKEAIPERLNAARKFAQNSLGKPLLTSSKAMLCPGYPDVNIHKSWLVPVAKKIAKTEAMMCGRRENVPDSLYN